MSDTTQRPTLAACVEHGVITFEQAVRILEDRGYHVRCLFLNDAHMVIATYPDVHYMEEGIEKRAELGVSADRDTSMVNFLKANDL